MNHSHYDGAYGMLLYLPTPEEIRREASRVGAKGKKGQNLDLAVWSNWGKETAGTYYCIQKNYLNLEKNIKLLQKRV